MTGELADRRILVPESRELDRFAAMLEARGATTLRCPLVTILDAVDPRPIAAWLERLADGKFDDLILLTGEGLRRLLVVAEHTGSKDRVITALGHVRTIIRGPKPARALRDIGLTPGLTALRPTTEGVIETLSSHDLKGRTIGVQLYPGNPNDKLLDFLRGAGASPDPILPYRYASDSEVDAVVQAIQSMADGKIDLVAFTSSPQVQRLIEVARDRNLETVLKAGLARTRIAAVGPVVAATIAEIGGKVDVLPENSFHLKPLVTAIVAALEPDRLKPLWTET